MYVVTDKLSEAAGWYGTAAIVGAYALISFKLIPSDGYIYQLLNLTGALGIIVVSIKKGVRQPAVLNAFWAVIAIVALISLLVK